MTEKQKCGICGAEGELRDYCNVNSTHHWGWLPCGHKWERHISSSPMGMRVVTSYDERTGEFSIDGAHYLPRFQVRSTGRLDRFLAAFKAERNIKAAMVEAYEAQGFGGLWELINKLLPGYYDKVGRMRARLITLATALLPIEDQQYLNHLISQLRENGAVEKDEIAHYLLI